MTSPSPDRHLADHLVVAVGTVAASALLSPLRHVVDLANLALLYVLGVELGLGKPPRWRMLFPRPATGRRAPDFALPDAAA